MRSSVVAGLAVALLLPSGCKYLTSPTDAGKGGGGSGNVRAQLEGTKWSSLPGTFKGEAVAPGALRIEFAAGGKLGYKDGANEMTGTYAVAGDELTLTFDHEYMGKTVHTEKAVVTPERLTLTDPDGSSVSFETVK